MATLTEKLLLAIAVRLFGRGNEQKLRLYLISRSPEFNLENWEEIYRNVEAEARERGYVDVVDYCRDVRYLRLLEECERCRKEPRCSVTEYQENTVVRVIDERGLSVGGEFKSFLAQNDRDSYLCIAKAPSEEKEEVCAGGGNNSNSLPLIGGERGIVGTGTNAGVSKRAWSRMTDTERKFEAHFSSIERKNYFSDDLIVDLPKNPLTRHFPKDEAGKSTVTDKEVETSPPHTTDPYEQLVNRLCSNKKAARSKFTWQSDYKIIAKYLFSALKVGELGESLVKEAQRVFTKHEIQLQDAVLNAMAAVQKIVFESKDPEFIKKMCLFKHRFGLLNDFYKN